MNTLQYCDVFIFLLVPDTWLWSNEALLCICVWLLVNIIMLMWLCLFLMGIILYVLLYIAWVQWMPKLKFSVRYSVRVLRVRHAKFTTSKYNTNIGLCNSYMPKQTWEQLGKYIYSTTIDSQWIASPICFKTSLCHLKQISMIENYGLSLFYTLHYNIHTINTWLRLILYSTNVIVVLFLIGHSALSGIVLIWVVALHEASSCHHMHGKWPWSKLSTSLNGEGWLLW